MIKLFSLKQQKKDGEAAAKNEKEERMLTALRKHIFYERQRKKQEQEAEVEEERLRKEREARERRDVLTLGETREKIQALEARHRELQEEKQQLFLTLKKVLNEDENRKKQQQKESNEMYAMHNHNLVPQQGSFMPPRPMQDRMPGGNNSGNSMHGGRQGGGNSGPSKRTRSPSPTPQHYYKGGLGSGGGGTGQYPHAPKIDEGRRVGEVGRAVLWNKPNPYSSSPGTLFYQTPMPNPPPDPTSGRGGGGGGGGGGHPMIPYSTIASQHHRMSSYRDLGHMNPVPGTVGPKPMPGDMGQHKGPPPGVYMDMSKGGPGPGKITLEKLVPPQQQQQGGDRNMNMGYHHEQERNKQQQQQQQQQQQPHRGLVYDYISNCLRYTMPGGPPLPGQPQPPQPPQQQPDKMPPGGASITRGYMKRGIND